MFAYFSKSCTGTCGQFIVEKRSVAEIPGDGNRISRIAQSPEFAKERHALRVAAMAHGQVIQPCLYGLTFFNAGEIPAAKWI